MSLPQTASACADEARLAPLSIALLDAVLAVEQRCYSHPWTRGNFIDALATGYQAQVLLGGCAGGDTGCGTLLGYFVAMQGVDEAHLLNLTVAPEAQRQGWARVLLDALALWARGQRAQALWLEVRQSNTRARCVYEACGFQGVGVRKRYYPLSATQREDAIVMRRDLP